MPLLAIPVFLRGLDGALPRSLIITNIAILGHIFQSCQHFLDLPFDGFLGVAFGRRFFGLQIIFETFIKFGFRFPSSRSELSIFIIKTLLDARELGLEFVVIVLVEFNPSTFIHLDGRALHGALPEALDRRQ